MFFKKVESSTRKRTHPETMEAAVKEVMDGAALRPTAENYGIDKMTLRHYVFKFKEGKSYTKFSLWNIHEKFLMKTKKKHLLSI